MKETLIEVLITDLFQAEPYSNGAELKGGGMWVVTQSLRAQGYKDPQ